MTVGNVFSDVFSDGLDVFPFTIRLDRLVRTSVTHSSPYVTPGTTSSAMQKGLEGVCISHR